MRCYFLLSFLIFLISCFLDLAECTATAYINAKVFTGNESYPWAEAVVVEGTTIAFVGNTSDATDFKTATDKVVKDMGGRMMMAGFQDSHLHPVEAGVNSDNCEFTRTLTLSTFEDEFVNCQTVFKDSAWILGARIGIDTVINELARQNLNPLAYLNSLEGTKPVLLLDDLGHSAWANTAAISAAGISTVSDPQGGLVHRDSNGDPTGIFFENAQQKLRDAAWPFSTANLQYYRDKLVNSMKNLSSNGITTVSDAGGFWSRFGDTAWIEVLKEGNMTVRASNALYLYPDLQFDSQVTSLKRKFDSTSSLLRFEHVKIYIDGILTLGTAAMKQPYDTVLGIATQSNDGFLYFSSTLLRNYTTALVSHGFQIHFHAVGDRAVRIALDEINAVKGLGTRQHRLTHLYQVDAADIPLFKTYNAVADFQLSPSSQTDSYISSTTDLIGSSRTDRLQPFEEVVAAGVETVLSSDWDADILSPFVKIQTILKRTKANPVSLTEILKKMTSGPAKLLNQDSTTGTIDVGKYADMIVLSDNIFETPIDKIQNITVVKTIFNGKEVHSTFNAGTVYEPSIFLFVLAGIILLP